MIKISIVIPTLTNFKGFKDCIASIWDKSDSVDELIIIDNSEIKEQSIWLFEQGVPFDINIIAPNKSLSVSESWNIGIKVARNDAVAVLNDDIEILTDHWDTILTQEWEHYTDAAIICPWPVSSENEHLKEDKPYDGLNGSFFVLSKIFVQETNNYKTFGNYIDTFYKKAYWEDCDLLKQVRDVKMQSLVSRKVRALHIGNNTAGKLYPAKCVDDPYTGNLKYLNSKYGTKINGNFKVFMSNILDENSDRRLI